MVVGLMNTATSSNGEALAGVARPEEAPRANLLRSAPVFVLLAVAVTSEWNHVNPDLWRQILSGRQILHTGSAHLYDIFSYTAYGLPVRDHEWLAQVVMALFYDALGVRGLFALKLLCAGATMASLACAFAETGASARLQRIILILIAIALAPNMQFRPQLFTFALLALEAALLARETYRGPARSLWLMVPGFALWANLHGGFIAGLGAMGLFTVVTGVVEFRSGHLRRGAALSALTAACALATLANPFGFHVWTTVLSSTTNATWHKAMADWKPLPKALVEELRAGSLNGALVVVLVPLGFFAALAAFVALAPSGDDLPLVSIAAVFVAATFRIIRFAPLAEVIVAVPLTRHAELYFRRRVSARLPRAPDFGFSPFLAAILAGAVAWMGGLLTNRLTMYPGFFYPVGAVAFMSRQGLSGNVLSEFQWSSYVMWHMLPDSRIFIEERAEILYPDNVLKDYLDFYLDRPGAERVLAAYPNQYVLVPLGSKVEGAVARNADWKLIYRDNVAALFARAGSHAASRFPSPVNGSSPPAFFP